MSESDPWIFGICSNVKALPLDDLSGALSLMYFYQIFVETRNGKACMSPGVCETENLEISFPKTWPRNFYTKID